MKHEVHSKVCLICKENFIPDPRVGDRQKVCKKLSCKLQRKKRAQQNWLSKNPGYFKGRYLQLKHQILANNKRLAQSKPPACFSIQDELTSNQNKLLTALKYIMSIQDEITRKITKGKYCLQDTLTLVYKTS
jgi:hypothetical protein